MPARAFLEYDQIAAKIGEICTKFVDNLRSLKRYHITGSNDYYAVLNEIQIGITNSGLYITHADSTRIDVQVQEDIMIYIFLSETDADTLLVTISTNSNIVP